jgi:DNA repair protein RecO (recombination protein O)
MEWSDDAIVLSARAHGESAAILEVLTRAHGRHLGLVRAGTSRNRKPALQPGNTLHVQWRARLAEHLGSFSLEQVRARAGDMLESRDRLIGLNAFTATASAVLPEREPHGALFDAGELLLDAIRQDGFAHWGPLYVRWEVGLLDALGFGLDLSRCAVTGTTDDLCYVSPRTGRAVSREAGAAYAPRLFALPFFLLGSQNAPPSSAEVAEGLRMAGHFLAERVLAPQGKDLPPARLRLDALAARESDKDRP